MIVPGKFITFNDSVLSHLTQTLVAIDKPMRIANLFSETRKHFASVSEFIYAIDVLYLLGVIEVDPETKVVSRAR